MTKVHYKIYKVGNDFKSSKMEIAAAINGIIHIQEYVIDTYVKNEDIEKNIKNFLSRFDIEKNQIDIIFQYGFLMPHQWGAIDLIREEKKDNIYMQKLLNFLISKFDSGVEKIIIEDFGEISMNNMLESLK